MSYQYPNYLFPDYEQGSFSAAGADGQGLRHDVAWAPSPEAEFPTTYSTDTRMTCQNQTPQGGVLPSTAGADGQSFSAAVCPGYGVGDQPPYTPNITVPNQDHHRGSGRSSLRDSDRKLECVKGAPIESYESFIIMDRHPMIVGRQLNDGQDLQTSQGQSQSDEPPSAFMQHKSNFPGQETRMKNLGDFEKRPIYPWNRSQKFWPAPPQSNAGYGLAAWERNKDRRVGKVNKMGKASDKEDLIYL